MKAAVMTKAVWLCMTPLSGNAGVLCVIALSHARSFPIGESRNTTIGVGVADCRTLTPRIWK